MTGGGSWPRARWRSRRRRRGEPAFAALVVEPPATASTRKGRTAQKSPDRIELVVAGVTVRVENRVMVASLVATCKMSDVNPVDDLADTLHALLDGHPNSRIEELMPWQIPQSVKPRRAGRRRSAYPQIGAGAR